MVQFLKFRLQQNPLLQCSSVCMCMLAVYFVIYCENIQHTGGECFCPKYHLKGKVLSQQFLDLLIQSEPVCSLRSLGMKPLSIPKLRLKMRHGRSQNPRPSEMPSLKRQYQKSSHKKQRIHFFFQISTLICSNIFFHLYLARYIQLFFML